MLDRKLVLKVLREVKKAAGLDFALGSGNCCNTCTWSELQYDYEKKGIPEPHGIYIKWFRSGMNKSDWESSVHWISHALTEEQKPVVMDVLSKYFKVEWDMSDSKSIAIMEMETTNETVSN